MHRGSRPDLCKHLGRQEEVKPWSSFQERAEIARRIVTDPAAPSAEGLWDAAREAQQERADRCGVNRNAGEYEEFRHRVEVGT